MAAIVATRFRRRVERLGAAPRRTVMMTLRTSLLVALVAALAAPGLARSAERSPKVAVHIRPIAVDHGVVRATPPPVVIDTPCVQAAKTYSTFDFTSGGLAIVQAGMAQTEMEAASYVLTAADFPVRLDAAQSVWGTQNATVTTTTQWSLFVWEGLPSTGTVIISVQSDGISIPHLVLPPGTNASVVEVDFLPDAPDNIIIPDNGTHTFSIGFRIDHHNQQTGNPCTVAPPSCCNAFPTVDTGGLQFSPNNWLYGVNCGAFGCPANGGWATFAALPAFCRPSGDWNLRAVYLPSYATAEVPGITCNDGIDNDCDGFADCDDSNCAADPLCALVAAPEVQASRGALSLEVPNPLPRAGAEIRLVVPVSGAYRLDVYDVAGRAVQSLGEMRLSAGEHTILWAPGAVLDAVPAGTYFVRVAGENAVSVTKKVTVVR